MNEVERRYLKAMEMKLGGKPYPLLSQKAKLLGDYYSIDNDLTTVVKMMDLLLENPPSDLAEAFYSNALIKYRRCFSSGRRKTLNAKDVEFNKTTKEMHEFYSNLASKYIAHSVNGFEIKGVDAIIKNGKLIDIQGYAGNLIGEDHDAYKAFKLLLRLIKEEIVAPKIKSLKEELLSETKKIPLEKLIKAGPRRLAWPVDKTIKSFKASK